MVRDELNLGYLPSAEELPHSDDTPVDNELQNLIPNLLGAILALAWGDRSDWFFGVDMGVYYAPNRPAIVPDGFLSLGVERFTGERGRLSYVFWEENWTVPTLVLEVVSQNYGGEYDRKLAQYAQLGVLYYAVYLPEPSLRRDRDPLEVYRLVDGEYERLAGHPVWLPEVGLGLGCDRGVHQGWEREWLYWYDRQGTRLSTPEELANQERQRTEREQQRAEREQQRAEREQQRAEREQQRAEREQQRAERLAARLRELGIDPSQLDDD